MIQGGQRLELGFWAALPSIITFMFLILCLAPKHMGGLSSFMPLLPLMPMFYWGLMEARDMPYWFVFIVGLIMDATQGLPLGLSSLLYIAFLALLRAQRKYIHKEGFVIKWGYFALLFAVIDIFNLMLLSSMKMSLHGVQPMIIQWLLTVACYPLLHRFFDAIYEHVHERRWRILHGS